MRKMEVEMALGNVGMRAWLYGNRDRKTWHKERKNGPYGRKTLEHKKRGHKAASHSFPVSNLYVAAERPKDKPAQTLRVRAGVYRPLMIGMADYVPTMCGSGKSRKTKYSCHFARLALTFASRKLGCARQSPIKNKFFLAFALACTNFA